MLFRNYDKKSVCICSVQMEPTVVLTTYIVHVNDVNIFLYFWSDVGWIADTEPVDTEGWLHLVLWSDFTCSMCQNLTDCIPYICTIYCMSIISQQCCLLKSDLISNLILFSTVLLHFTCRYSVQWVFIHCPMSLTWYLTLRIQNNNNNKVSF